MLFSSLQAKESYISKYDSYKKRNIYTHTQWERTKVIFVKGLIYTKSFTYLTQSL